MASTAPRPTTPVPSVSQAVAILRLLGSNAAPLGVTGIARALGLSPSSAFNLSRTLVAEGLLEFDAQTKTYRMGMGSIDLARMALRGDAVIAAARPAMERLAERIDAAVGLWRVADRNRLLLVSLSESEAATRIHMAVGQRQPWGAGSTGRAFLAAHGADEAAVRAAFAGVRWTGKIDADAFVAQVAAARRLGFASDNQWLNPGIVTVAAVVPDGSDTPRYCLSASMFAGRNDARRLNEIGQEMLREAALIGRVE